MRGWTTVVTARRDEQSQNDEDDELTTADLSIHAAKF